MSDPTDPPPHDYLVVLRTLPGDHGPVLVRLRRALKALLRGFALRAIVVAPVDDDAGQPSASPLGGSGAGAGRRG
jgi:hypothetical protein